MILKKKWSILKRKVEVLKVKKGRLSIGKQERSKLVSLKERYVFIFLHTLIVIISQSISFLSYNLIRYRNSLDLGRIIKVTSIVDILMKSWWMVYWSHVEWCLLKLKLGLFSLELFSLDWDPLIMHDSRPRDSLFNYYCLWSYFLVVGFLFFDRKQQVYILKEKRSTKEGWGILPPKIKLNNTIKKHETTMKTTNKLSWLDHPARTTHY